MYSQVGTLVGTLVCASIVLGETSRNKKTPKHTVKYSLGVLVVSSGKI